MNRLVAILFTGLLAISLAGCGSDSKKSVVDPGGSLLETDLGNQALASGDYASANAHYRAAIAKDPANGEAQFGAGVTEV